MADDVVTREEAIPVLFAILDMNKTLLRIETLLRDDGEEAEEDQLD